MNTDRQPACGGNSAWVTLNTMLNARRREILDREMRDECLIHLYAAGDYWVAFEQSACRLNRLFPDSEISALRLDGYPFPVVMVAVGTRLIDDYSRRNPVRETDPNHRILSGRRLSSAVYSRWHFRVLSSVG